MTGAEKDKAIAYFESLYKQYGVDEKSLGWSKNKQNIRFEQVFKHIKESTISVLDVGCGFGDMYSYLEQSEKYVRLEYCGIDIMNSFLDVAKEKHSNNNTEFVCTGLLEYEPNRTWDWVVECGLFGLNVYGDEEKMYEYIEKSMQKAFLLADKGISFNFLSDKVDFRTSGTDFHISPERVLELAYRLSRRVILDNSIMPFEFTITVWKDDSFLAKTTVFESYLQGEV